VRAVSPGSSKSSAVSCQRPTGMLNASLSLIRPLERSGVARHTAIGRPSRHRCRAVSPHRAARVSVFRVRAKAFARPQRSASPSSSEAVVEQQPCEETAATWHACQAACLDSVNQPRSTCILYVTLFTGTPSDACRDRVHVDRLPTLSRRHRRRRRSHSRCRLGPSRPEQRSAWRCRRHQGRYSFEVSGGGSSSFPMAPAGMSWWSRVIYPSMKSWAEHLATDPALTVRGQGCTP
jgi:hypothetical protein